MVLFSVVLEFRGGEGAKIFFSYPSQKNQTKTKPGHRQVFAGLSTEHSYFPGHTARPIDSGLYLSLEWSSARCTGANAI